MTWRKRKRRAAPVATEEIVDWYVAWAVMSGAREVSHKRVFLLAALADRAYHEKRGYPLITGNMILCSSTVKFDDLKSVSMPHEEGYDEVYAHFCRTYAYDRALEGHLIQVASDHLLMSDEELEAKVLSS